MYFFYFFTFLAIIEFTTGYPTLMFFQKGNKVGDQYFGPKVRADLMSFINEKMGKISEEEKVSYLIIFN